MLIISNTNNTIGITRNINVKKISIKIITINLYIISYDEKMFLNIFLNLVVSDSYII